MEWNGVERRALRTAAILVVLGAAVRTGCGPGPAEWAWRPHGALAEAGPAGVRDSVAAALEREARAARPLAPGERLDPNVAPEEELRRLSGVGPERARAIVAGRQAGPYAAPEDLLRVPGIGPATLARLEPSLAFPPPGARPAAAAPAALAGPGGSPRPLDLNLADSAALLQLPGIGPARAGRILDARAAAGGFQSVEELLEVPGIGPRTLDRLRPLVTTGSGRRRRRRSAASACPDGRHAS